MCPPVATTKEIAVLGQRGVLETGITKIPGSVVANKDVNFRVGRGEVHALVGDIRCPILELVVPVPPAAEHESAPRGRYAN